MTRRRRRGALAVSPLACFVAVLSVVGGSSAIILGGGATAAATSGTAATAYTQTETITRTYEAADGSTSVVTTKKVTLDVSQTTGLEGRQEIGVSWSGAHPTGGLVANENSASAQYEEYPVVLLQCRGTASGTDEVTPETCWTAAPTERYQQSNSSDTSEGGLYPPYRLDQYATTPTAHEAVVGQPKTLPTTAQCESNVGTLATPVRYWVPWVAAGGKVYAGGEGSGFCGQPPQGDGGITPAFPSNETFGVTATDGTGSTDFEVFTTAENTTLGCTDTVACSLVAVPIMGISCDAKALGTASTKTQEADLTVCMEKGSYKSGTGVGSRDQETDNGDDLTVSGALWWSPSNWRNRIVVPLTFDPPANACNVVTSGSSVSAYGSTLLVQATDQWDPSFCTRDEDKFSFVQVATPEPEARNLVATGSADAALTSYAQPGGYGQPVVNAPVAVTGFTISYDITGTNGEPITALKLTPLLLAKLLTESYQANPTYRDPALAGNPLNITDTPEFIFLNPTVAPVLGKTYAESELVSISSDSDVIEAVTTYINDTPAARAWLDGTSSGEPSVCNATGVYQAGATDPCPAMVVNPAYQGIQLPVDQWPLLSTYESTGFDSSVNIKTCLADAPEPLSSLIAAPLANLEDVSEAMQFEEANSTVVCSPDIPGDANSMVATGRQEAGYYFMLGITPLADDERYGLPAAALQTTPGTFVTPTDASLEAATSLLTPDTTTGTWPIPYTAFQTAAGASAYPGTMVVYAAIPTSGLSTTDAQDYASFLTFAATTGQTPGSGVGELPPGYLPMTAADGLGELADYTLAAAADVAAQNGEVPPLVPSPSTTSQSTSQTTSQSQTASTEPVSELLEPDVTFPLFSTASALATASSTTATGATSHAKKEQTTSKPVRLPPTADVALWTGGAPVVLVMGLALLVLMGVLALFRLGRRRGRW